jgi:predicted hydrolase (HD superfamily)
MNLPTEQECYALLKEHDAEGAVLQHSENVRKIAVFLARMLKEAGESVDIDLVDRSALLHDLHKIEEITEVRDNGITLDDVKRHEDRTYDLLKDKYPELAEVIRKHKYILILEEGLDTWEQKLIYYADKRVAPYGIVSLDERLKEGHKRYSKIQSKELDKLIFCFSILFTLGFLVLFVLMN